MIELRSLVEIALRRFGCHWEAVEENLLHAAIPAESPMRQILDIGDSTYLALVEFEEDRIAGLEPVRHLIPGSIYLDRFFSSLTEEGTVGDVVLPSAYTRPDDLSVRCFLMDAIRDTSDCAITKYEEEGHRCVTFHFIIDLFAIEASKALVSVTFDFDSKRLISNPNINELQNAEVAVIEITDSDLTAAMPTVLESIRAEACCEIESYAMEHSTERSSAKKKLQRLARKQGDYSQDQRGLTKNESLDHQLEDIVHDWDQRIRHAESQYLAEGAQITLVSATRQIRPFGRFEINFPGRSGNVDTWKVLYDLTSGTFLLPECNSCGATVNRLAIGEGLCSHPLCESCANVTPGCSHPTCKPCLRKCHLCTGTICPNCSFQCNYVECFSILCEKHRRVCSSCDKSVCRTHRQFCKRCERSFCIRCSRNHEWKRADCGHLVTCSLKPKFCRVCGTVLCMACIKRCDRCGGHACNKHSVECLSCGSHVCERCYGFDCAACGADCCRDHSFQCKRCMQYFCYEHSQWCAVCNRIICDRHVNICRSCQSPLCVWHSREITEGTLIRCAICDETSETTLLCCTNCERLVHRKLLLAINGTNEILCIECRSKCSRCSQSMLVLEIEQCVTCGQLLCNDCLVNHANECITRHITVGEKLRQIQA